MLPLRLAPSDDGDPRKDEHVPVGLERRFAEEYFSGEHAGNGTRSLMKVVPGARYDRASVQASILLKSDKVQRFLRELHETATDAIAAELRPYPEYMGLAQQVIVATAEGRLRNRLAFEAAVYITNRVMGTPVATSEVHVRNDERVARALAAFAKRVDQEQRRTRTEEAK
jgi:hypothetical protein